MRSGQFWILPQDSLRDWMWVFRVQDDSQAFGFQMLVHGRSGAGRQYAPLTAKAESGHVLGLVFRDLRAAYASVAQARVWACEEGPKTGARMTSMTRTESHL